jgi:hypothetical protein
MKRITKKQVLGGVVVLLLVVVLIVWAAPSMRQFKTVSCGQAVDAAIAQKLWDANQKTVAKVRSLQDSSSHIYISLDTETCPGKAFIYVLYGTQKGSDKVDYMLKHSPLRSIPVQWHNG